MMLIRWFWILLIFVGAQMAAGHGPWGVKLQGIVVMAVAVFFWKIGPITDWLEDRRWRDDFREW